MNNKQALLQEPIQHISLDDFDPTALIASFEKMAFQARNTARAARIFEKMLADQDCTVILCLAGSLVSAGLRRVIAQLIETHMADVIVSTGANIVDQDFFEGLGFHHYAGSKDTGDAKLRELGIDRIYDTFIDEEQLRVCDEEIARLADSLEPRTYSSREFIATMGHWLTERHAAASVGSIVRTAFENDVPIFCPAFSDCSAGFGLLLQRSRATAAGKASPAIDSVRDFDELTKIKLDAAATGLFMVGGGVPKNFAQDIVVAAELLAPEREIEMHRYAVQITVADERDGALSGSTLEEACSWGKVQLGPQQMVFGEATVLLPLIAGWAYRSVARETREGRRLSRCFAGKAASAT